MSAKTIAARRAAFLKALRETGSLTLSAERARVGKEWSLWHRKRDPVFATACAQAIAAARAKLEAERETRGFSPPKGWGTLDGVQLVVRGAPGRQVQVRRARVDGWSPAVEDRFLGVLAATCNVKAACAAIRMTQASAYYHRRRWAPFDRRWHAAVEEGYVRIEMGLLEHAGNMFSPREYPPDIEMPPMRVDEAMHLLHMHKHDVRGIGGRPGARAWKPSQDAVADKILRGVEAIKRGRKLSPA